jgi:hypothetical protein
MTVDEGRIPLVIGVTGHRNPAAAEVASIEAGFEKALRQLDAAAPNTPLLLLTPLALGCDRIAARVALRFRRAKSSDRVRVVGVFPFAIDDYRRDFAGDAADAAEFESLLPQLEWWFELPRWEHAEVDANGFVVKQVHRDLHYRRLGLFVALQSQVVIAMWDGVRNNKVGGTAEVVDFCLGKRPAGPAGGIPFRSRPMLLAPPDVTSLLCVPTRREGAQSIGAESVELAQKGLHEADRRRFADFDLLNRRLQTAPASGWRPKMACVEPRADSHASGRWNALRERFLRLDALAGRAKREHVLTAWIVPALGAIGIGGFEWFSSFANDAPKRAWIPLAVYIAGLVAAAFVWWALVFWRRSEWVFVHARALAEAMRIQYAWIGSGVAEVAPDLYFARRNAEVAFLRAQLRAAVLDGIAVSCRGGIGAGTEVGVRWIKEQCEYFAAGSNPIRKRDRHARWQKFGAWALRCGVLGFSLLLFASTLAEALGASGEVARWADLGCFLVGVALALAVAFSYWRDVMLDQEDLDSAGRMRAVFDRAEELLERSPERAHEILVALGKESLDEHADWFARHRDRLRLPDAG